MATPARPNGQRRTKALSPTWSSSRHGEGVEAATSGTRDQDTRGGGRHDPAHERRLLMLLPGASIVDATPAQLDRIAAEMLRRADATRGYEGASEPQPPGAGPRGRPG